LENNVKKVYAIEVGTDQMHEKIRNDERIILKENTNARDYINEEKVDFICCDVSFISVTKLISSFQKNLKEDGQMVILVKPQFEAGEGKVINGIIKDKKILRDTVNNVKRIFKENNFNILNITESPIKGSKGNTEFLFNIVKKNT
jgi:23S rRNA (cytidine1920-2'-O)/16S rRNA (cytidine1409-2'-O)-methyltransferase